METKFKLSDVINSNVGWMLNNWAREHIRCKYDNSIDEYICKNVTSYISSEHIYNDITHQEAVSLLKYKFNNPITTLANEIQTMDTELEEWLISEFADAIRYYGGQLIEIDNEDL